MARRVTLLIAAALVAALGTILVFVYVRGVDDRALANQKPAKVLIAKTIIAAGTTAQQASSAGAFELREIAASAVAPGAISDIAAIGDKVALTPIYPGEQILPVKFGVQGDISSLPIPKGKLAISIQLSDPARVAGFVQPGSSVSIFVTLAAGVGGGASDFTRVLLPRVQVIAAGPTTVVPTTTSGTNGQTNQEVVPKAILTLAVDQIEAQKVIYASQKGQLYFGLLTKDSAAPTGTAVSATNLFG